jgi:hypothetical protein
MYFKYKAKTWDKIKAKPNVSGIRSTTMKKCLLGISACLLFMSSLAVAGEWIEDPINGCEVWNEEPSSGGDVISWSGECENGKASGHGVLAWFTDGALLARYVGGLKAGKLDGVGELVIQPEQGDRYDHYEAEFVDGELEGEVGLEAANGDHFQGHMKQSVVEGYGSYIGANGDRYDGDFVNGLPEGSGFSEAEDGELYKGAFKAGVRHGEGTLVDVNGDEFEGVFVDGVLQGWGSWQGSDGSRFEGQFENGKPNGQGIYKAPNGDIYSGGFAIGVADGEMSVTTKDGQQSTQVWSNGEQTK